MRPITVDTTEVWGCANPRCSSGARPLCRHHKGFDSFVGRYNLGIGRNYHRFLDCVVLCLECHCTIHYIYEDYILKWTNRTPRGAAHFRKVLIGVCDKWLNGKIPTPKVPKKYLQKFRESYLEWQKNQEKLGTGSTVT